jgi:hypothetical protein
LSSELLEGATVVAFADAGMDEEARGAVHGERFDFVECAAVVRKGVAVVLLDEAVTHLAEVLEVAFDGATCRVVALSEFGDAVGPKTQSFDEVGEACGFPLDARHVS